jgi:Ca2+-binding EF-hand superfamily protein
LKSKNKPINFDEFLDLICPKVGDLKSKEGLKAIFNHIDKGQDGGLDF